MDRRLVVLAASLDPFHRSPADQLAGEHHEGHVGVAEDLRSERAADVGADAPHLVLGDAGHERRQQEALDVRRLARHPDRVLVGARVVPADVAADLHRVGDQAVIDEPLLDDDLGVGDRLVRAVLVADRPGEDFVVRGVVVELGSTGLHGGLGIDDGRERLPVDLDGLECVDRLLGCLGDDRRHAFAGPLDGVGGEDPRRADVVLDARRAAGRPGHGQRVVGDVGAGEGRQDARHRLRGVDVHRADVRVGVGAAEDRQVGHPG